MKINCIYGHNFDSNIYLILGEETTIIDCGTGLYNSEVNSNIKNIVDPENIKQIILTHEHYDHCGGVKDIFNLTGKKAKVISHFNASEKIEKGESQFAKMLGGVMPKMPIDIKLNDGEEIQIGDEKFQVLHTPGHTPGCICLYHAFSKSLISGDTVFSNGSFGRYDFPGGNLQQLKNSINRLAGLDVENLYPGHESFIEGGGNSHLSLSLKNICYLF